MPSEKSTAYGSELLHHWKSLPVVKGHMKTRHISSFFGGGQKIGNWLVKIS